MANNNNRDSDSDDDFPKKNANKVIRRASTITEEMMEKIKAKDLYPIQLRFENLKFSFPTPKPEKDKYGEWKTVIHGVTGSFEPGTITAIMGSSGAGKTTLLNLLAGRAAGKIDGTVLYNGNPRDKSGPLMKHQAYVMQDDLMMRTCSAKEIITFSALLRIDDTHSMKYKLKLVKNIIEELNIADCQHTRVGEAGIMRGVSGGQRKRIAIGCELVTNPSLLYLDEPTSGLDSFTAEHVMEAMGDLAHSGRTVVCTIHQPSSQIFNRLDRLILLARGRLVYYGPVNQAVSYFNSIGHPVPAFTNPPDHFMKLIYIDETNRQESEERVTSLIEAYEQSDLANKMKKEFELYEVPIEENDHGSQYGQPTFSQMRLLMHRAIFHQTFREPLKIRASLAQSIVLSLLVGLVYLQINDDQQSVQDRQGALFFICVNQMLSAVVGQVNTFPAERVLFYREHANNMYSMPAFFFSKIFADLPFQLLYPTIFSIISYFMVGFQSSRFVVFWLLVLLIANVGASMGLLVGIKAKDATTAISSVPLVVIPFMLFSGFLINVNSTPPYFIWIEYLSPIKYCFQGISINEFTDLTFTCSSDEKVPILVNGTITGYECRVPDGEAVIDNLGFQDVEIWQDFVALIILYLGYRILGFLALFRQVRATKANA
eukprot:CAMPEP_0168569962 /NCGR_PEP_ID=MMETSP0413-20121227/16461_1 /TAXON_ID=136452 /ORGANISM="Filamoeba nolandi, Strain NC-AS-23-1" /LENGTH=655 /DNA_ID=CAMNT_0008602541 /DNA_START=78 /DNA_END=2045 /DNA_ORIENTATION=-